MLRLSPTADEELAALREELDQAYRRTAERFADNEAIRVESKDGRDALVLSPLDAIDEPQSLIDLRANIAARLPRVDLPDVLLEVDAWTGFTKEFSHASEGRARVEDLATSVCAVLIAEACNLIPGTLRDSIYILEGLLQNETSLRPVRIMTDTASYSDLVFGLFRLLGYQFSPRLADLGGARLWRLDQGADYGPLNAIARHRIGAKLIRMHWNDTLRVAGSLAFGTVNATELVRALQGGGRPTTLGRAIAEYGRIAKTLHLLHVIDDESYRRQMLIQLNRQESRHSLARDTFHGKRGELRQPYREGQEDQLSALGLVVNAIVLWNTQYMDVALGQLRTEGNVPMDQDIERLSPLGHDHLNLHGRYYFGLPEAVLRGELRPLRDPRDGIQEL